MEKQTDGEKRPLTKKQQRVLDHIKAEIEKNGFPPAIRDIGKQLGISSTSTVHNYLKAIEERGHIMRVPNKPRAMKIL